MQSKNLKTDSCDANSTLKWDMWHLGCVRLDGDLHTLHEMVEFSQEKIRRKGHLDFVRESKFNSSSLCKTGTTKRLKKTLVLKKKKKKVKKEYIKEKERKVCIVRIFQCHQFNSINCVWTVIHLLSKQNRFPCTFAPTFPYMTWQISHHAIMFLLLPLFFLTLLSFSRKKEKRNEKAKRITL